MMADSFVPGEFEDEGAEHPVSATSSSGGNYVKCEGFMLPHLYPTVSEKIRAMEIRSDDVWLCGIPFSGTRWVQDAVWCIANDVDLETAETRILRDRFPLLDESVLKEIQMPVDCVPTDPSFELPDDSLDSVAIIERLPSPRFVKSYLPLVFLPEALLSEKKAKIVYVSRNPQDVCLAMYRAVKCMYGYKQGFKAFVECFLEGRMYYLPHWKHILQFWRMRKKLNILFVTHEEMEKDLKKAILKIAQFFGKEVDEERWPELMEHLTAFKEVIQNKAENQDPADLESHLRGPSGQWRDVLMTESVLQRFRNWEKEHLKDIGYWLAMEQ